MATTTATPPAPTPASVTIATHSGTFHADEALAIAMLKRLPAYANATVVRTRNPAVYNAADIVVDVGGVYDPARHRYDHHQREFTDTYSSDHAVRLSSAGLVYKHFGPQVVAQILGWPATHPMLPTIVLKLYNDLIQTYDAIDNGVSMIPAALGKPAYHDTTTIGRRVERLNPRWNQPYTDAILDAQFVKAVALCGEEFAERVDYYGNCWLPGLDLVKQAMQDRRAVDPSGRVVLFHQSVPWKSHIYDLEQQEGLTDADAILYVLYPGGADPNGEWRVQAVAHRHDSFASRKPLPEAWRGVRDDAVAALTGVPDAFFVHASGFMAGCKSKAGALAMVKRALAAPVA
ncbi:hypothetical protein CXG81DRAFT_15607 [Caulochytrium protostelioides]|uniref:Metal-dependent protein hydrolase n=2 Tax=Caulochytrium protostelioides TaxID=1555241 RepID=A0A4V1ITY4_9FUNG|nr:hypothetical protein CXG81DRAFT_15607 [Caulochytrium protostelioides]|eukprot:RKO98667.1 hypothetical protein CXG81DRAFT_15607 [Caulochytrium protostelioides]